MNQQKVVFEFTDGNFARSVAGALQDLLEPAPAALTLFEAPQTRDGVHWCIEAYFTDPPEPKELAGRLAEILGRRVPVPDIEAVPDLNWVAISQAALPPVHAGRFTIYGSHDLDRVARGPNAILIDAGEAFGTAHHATTSGCLEAITQLTRRHAFRNVLDLGCGSGVLAVALSRVLPRAQILATDLDPQSVRVARENVNLNGAGSRVSVRQADGLGSETIRRAAPFDLLVANILAGPLIALSGEVARVVERGGHLVLSGLLVSQAPAVVATYRAKGFALESHTQIAGWSTVVLVRC